MKKNIILYLVLFFYLHPCFAEEQRDLLRPASVGVFSLDNNSIYIAVIKIEDFPTIDASLTWTGDDQLLFTLNSVNPTDNQVDDPARFSFTNNILHIPQVDFPGSSGVIQVFALDLLLIAESDPVLFQITNIVPLTK